MVLLQLFQVHHVDGELLGHYVYEERGRRVSVVCTLFCSQVKLVKALTEVLDRFGNRRDRFLDTFQMILKIIYASTNVLELCNCSATDQKSVNISKVGWPLHVCAFCPETNLLEASFEPKLELYQLRREGSERPCALRLIMALSRAGSEIVCCKGSLFAGQWQVTESRRCIRVVEGERPRAKGGLDCIDMLRLRRRHVRKGMLTVKSHASVLPASCGPSTKERIFAKVCSEY